MKNSLVISFFFFSTISIAQINFGGETLESTSSSIEFGEGNRGIILPWVASESLVDGNGAVPGTLIFDLSTFKVKVKTQNNGWLDLSIDETGIADNSFQQLVNENTSAKVVIGENADIESAPGILVLSDSDKGMVLPKVANPHIAIKEPSAGMMVYDTEAHLVAFYNGTVWTFWKP